MASTPTNAVIDPPQATDDASETSAAVVSLYNSWSSDSNLLEDDLVLDDSCQLPPFYSLSVSELEMELRKRLPAKDLPPVPRLRKRLRPNCSFLNYMGTRTDQHPPTTTTLNHDELDLGLSEKDALFPLYSYKAKHSEYLRKAPDQNETRRDNEVDH